MSVLEIISAILLILACVFIIAVVLMQESKQGMSNVISGGSNDNYFQKNSGRTKEAKLAKATKISAVIVFVVAVAVNIISAVSMRNAAADTQTPAAIELSEDDSTAAETTAGTSAAPADTTAAPAETTTAAPAETTTAAS